MITAIICILVGVAAVSALRLFSGSSLVSEAEMTKRDQWLTERTNLKSELATLQTAQAMTQQETDKKKSQLEALSAEIRQTTATQTTLATNLNAMQQQIAQLQQLQEQFRFKLLKGESGGVFVEVPPQAQSFQFAEKTYIQVK